MMLLLFLRFAADEIYDGSCLFAYYYAKLNHPWRLNHVHTINRYQLELNQHCIAIIIQ